MSVLLFPVTNEEIEPICDSMDIGAQNTILSIASGGCLPVAFASFGAKTHAVDNNILQIAHAIKRTWFFENGLIDEFLKDYDHSIRGKVNRDFMFGRAEFSKKIEGLIEYEEGDIFDVWCKKLDTFDRIYLSNAWGSIPKKLVQYLQKTPSGTLIYTSNRCDFENAQSVRTEKGFQKVFRRDDERTEMAERMADPFWTPAVYRKID